MASTSLSAAQPLSVLLIALLCVLVTCSVARNFITGDAAENLATAVLEHASMTDFCGIPLLSLRENSITELDLEGMGVGEPGAIVLSKLLPSAAALTSLKCATAPDCSPFCQHLLTCLHSPTTLPLVHSLSSNQLGAEGAAALAAILKETNITTLWSAAALEYSFGVSTR